MCITVRRYFDCSHVSIEFQCIHTYVSMLSLLVWRTKVQLQGGMSCPVKQNTPPLGHQYSMILVSVGWGRRGATSSDRGPDKNTMWVTLLEYILSLRRQVFSLSTLLSCGRDKEHMVLCVLIIPQEQAWLRVLARPGNFVPNTILREQGRIVTMPKFVCLRDFSRNPHGSTQYPLFRATVLAISPSSPLERGH
jgi:hypothetical protein